MSSIQKNIAGKHFEAKEGLKIGIVQSEYNSEITEGLFQSCQKTLCESGVLKENIMLIKVPGAFEIPFACQKLHESGKVDVIITLGALIKGETPHFDFIAKACSQSIMELGLRLNIPIIFGILTTDNIAQAKERVSKGTETALSALQMSSLTF